MQWRLAGVNWLESLPKNPDRNFMHEIALRIIPDPFDPYAYRNTPFRDAERGKPAPGLPDVNP
jgi:hypothetical protein